VKKFLIINEKIPDYLNKKIYVSGDKSLSIRFILFSSLASGKSIAKNLLSSEDVISAVNCIKKLGIKIIIKKNYCTVYGKGLWAINIRMIYS